MYFQVHKWARTSGNEEKNMLDEANVIKTKTPNCNMLHALMTDVNPAICCLCLNNLAEESPVQLEDEIYLDDCSESTVKVVEMIDCMLHREEFVSTSVCASCMTSTVSAFKFIDMCEQASKKLNKVVDSITSEFDNNDKKNFRRTYRLFIATDIDSLQSSIYYDNKKCLIPSKKSANYQSAFFRFKTICSPEILPICYNCGKTFVQRISLVRHIKNNNCVAMPCDSCGLFIARNCMLKHKQVCGRNYPTVGKKRDKMHDPETKKKCQKFGKKISTYKGKLGEHAKVCQKPRSKYPSNAKYKCNVCKAEYIRKGSLKFHMKIHSDNRDDYFECNWCKKRFSSQVQLKSHVVTHTQEKNFECTICGGKFVSQPSLTYHVRTHTGEKPYKCELCELKFLSASRRREHMRYKHLPPQLACLFCLMKFKTHGSLRRHHSLHLNPNNGLYLGKTQIEILAQSNKKVSALIKYFSNCNKSKE